MDNAALCWGFGLLEGALASLLMLLPAIVYHVAFGHVLLSAVPLELYAAYSTIVGVVYGACSAIAASKFLEDGEYQHVILTNSALAWTGAFAVALLGAFLAGKTGDLSRVSLTSAYVIGLPVLVGVRGVAHTAVGTRIRAGRLQYRKFAIIGNAADVTRFLLNGSLWRWGYQLAGRLHLENVRDDTGALQEQVIVDNAKEWVAKGAGYIVVVGELEDVDGLERLTNQLKRFAVNVACAPATDNTSFKFLDVVPMGANNALRFLRKPMGDRAVLLKRSLDVCGALFGLVLLAPLFALVAVIIALDSPGPVFYRQERRGFNGETFYIWKFRSMRVTESGRQMTQVRAGDDRITRVGRFIRAKSIDELPQLINVLRGEMSLVGPRPHALVHDDALGHELASYAHRQRIKPGITGWAQINGYRGETSTFEQIEGRTLHDLYYIDNWSIFLDCWIIVLTVFSRKMRLNAV
ncbi:MAG TPA: exopolysaccharide biosynthesis polyprenyl glycosylphosphotransferase [Devosiaceae bacterium]